MSQETWRDFVLPLAQLSPEACDLYEAMVAALEAPFEPFTLPALAGAIKRPVDEVHPLLTELEDAQLVSGYLEWQGPSGREEQVKVYSHDGALTLGHFQIERERERHLSERERRRQALLAPRGRVSPLAAD